MSALLYSVHTCDWSLCICGCMWWRCPQSYKAGWASPIPGGHISATSDLTPGIARTFTLPPAALTKNNMLRIVTDLANNVVNDRVRSPQRALFLSFRYVRTYVRCHYSSAGVRLRSHLEWLVRSPCISNTLRAVQHLYPLRHIFRNTSHVPHNVCWVHAACCLIRN
jgi:hypothetical protein